MKTKQLNEHLSVSAQIKLSDLDAIKAAGFDTIINNRPDGEAPRQPRSDTLAKRAIELGLTYHHIPVFPGRMTTENVTEFTNALNDGTGRALAFCRTGTRSSNLWARIQIGKRSAQDVISHGKVAGEGLGTHRAALDAAHKAEKFPKTKKESNGGNMSTKHTVIIIGGGSAGIATASSLLKRRPNLDVAIIEPSSVHYYQPGWTMVGGGVFSALSTERTMGDLMPNQAKWIKGTVAKFHPDKNTVELEDGMEVEYDMLVAAPGLKLDYHKIAGCEETLGKNGVTSNYRYEHAPYTWELVQNLKGGTAIFSQPPMPIKCAGAPQKAMYLSCDHWFRKGVLKNITVDFCNAGGVIFGVKEYVPALMEYVKKYDANLNFGENLIKVDGPNKMAWFEKTDADGKKEIIERKFDMLHVSPPQSAHQFVQASPLANEAGWIDVDPETLRHTRYTNIYALGDACSSPNAKTMAAARKQAPIVATNVLAKLAGKNKRAVYDGYGSCPLTVERGKIVLAEFGYGGKVIPSFPKWLIDGTKPSRLSWLLKERILPPIYWKGMLKGKEWLVKPNPNGRDEVAEIAE